jgi:hypothetical protein
MGADHASRSLFEKMPTTSVDLVGLQFIRLMTRMWIVPAEMWGDINWENTGLAPHFTSAQATGEAFSTAEKVEVSAKSLLQCRSLQLARRVISRQRSTSVAFRGLCCKTLVETAVKP